MDEPESATLRILLRGDSYQIASVLVAIELLRAVRRRARDLTPVAEGVLAQITLVEVTETIRVRAALLEPVALRSLDAVHVATALEVRDELGGLVTYDRRMAAAARNLGIPVLAPA